jgi:hypothetical protein
MLGGLNLMPLEGVATPEVLGSGMVVTSVRAEKASSKPSVVNLVTEGKVVPGLLLQSEVEPIERPLEIQEIRYERRFEIRCRSLEVSSL